MLWSIWVWVMWVGTWCSERGSLGIICLPRVCDNIIWKIWCRRTVALSLVSSLPLSWCSRKWSIRASWWSKCMRPQMEHPSASSSPKATETCWLSSRSAHSSETGLVAWKLSICTMGWTGSREDTSFCSSACWLVLSAYSCYCCKYKVSRGLNTLSYSHFLGTDAFIEGLIS